MGDWTRLSELLLERADRTNDPAMRESLRLRAAEHLERAGTAERALSILESVHTERPASVEASLRCAGVLMTLDRPHDALALLQSALDGARDKVAALRADVLLEMAKAHVALEQPACAFDALAAAFSIHRGNREVAMLLGVIAYELGDTKTAETALRAVLKLSADDSTDTELARHLLTSIAEAKIPDTDPEPVAPPARPSEIRMKDGEGTQRAAKRKSS
jgi:Flp pilus assembly protein TadD